MLPTNQFLPRPKRSRRARRPWLLCFQTMWTTTQLKRELMDYWKLLTEGPLYASEEAAAADLRNDSKSRLVRCVRPSTAQGGSSFDRKLVYYCNWPLDHELNSVITRWETELRHCVWTLRVVHASKCSPHCDSRPTKVDNEHQYPYVPG